MVLMESTFTLTFGDQAENHVGMQKIGQLASKGFALSDLERAREYFLKAGIECELVNLARNVVLESDEKLPEFPEAHVLIARGGLRAFVDPDSFYQEQDRLEKDSKAFMYGRVVNKHARHNLCFSEKSQEPDYSSGKGRIVAFDQVPLLSKVRDGLGEALGDIGKNLSVEGNYYYDPSKCGIGWHGDSERRKVVGVRVGKTLPLCYAWFYEGERISEPKVFSLHHGDIYVMSEKATGQDWKKKLVPTLRHAAGAEKYTKV